MNRIDKIKLLEKVFAENDISSLAKTEVVQKNGTLFCIKNAENGSTEYCGEIGSSSILVKD